MMMMTTENIILPVFDEAGVLAEETENNNPKWTVSEMEKFMREQSESSVSLGLISQPSLITSDRSKHGKNNIPDISQIGEMMEIVASESSPSWASSSTGNTPSFGSGGNTFEFNSKVEDRNTPVITTTKCTPHSTPENRGNRINSEDLTLTATTDLLDALDHGLELSLSKPRKSRKDSSSSDKGPSNSGSHGGTPIKTSKLSKLLRRTHSAGGPKDVSSQSHYSKNKTPVTKTKSADSAPCCRDDGDEKQKKNRKTLAQDMKMRLSFLRRRHTDSSLQPSVRPTPEEAHKWAESFQELTNSKYGLSLFRAFLSREFSDENIDFWLACEDYKRCRVNKLASKAKKIYDDYLAVSAPKEVNLDSSIRIDIQSHLQNPDRQSFDCAQRRIQGLMEQDAYVRFLQSDLYTDLAQGNSHTSS
ncbi:regulator of G-protein signaling 3 isoform X2 [Parasteatoda tepidariorum]|uniref:regulator of G-protein signaling 3 isoform X2 n=1 Tax=Parasteatoda tepidariorum TaxID=114398 RepID=UPI00077F89AC|nr:regulator of G-protein signaling 3 isoform X2 [Parasteatoda tepidariorum]